MLGQWVMIGPKYILHMQEGREEGKQSQVTHKSIYIQVILVVVMVFSCVLCALLFV